MRHVSWDEIRIEGFAFHLSRREYSAGEKFLMHTHDFAEIMFIESGEGKQHINNVKTELQAGCLVFVRPRDTHSLKAGNKGLLVHNIAFPFAAAIELERRYVTKHDGYFRENSPQPHTQILRGQSTAMTVNLFSNAANRPRDRLTLDHFILGIYQILRTPHAELVAANAPDWLKSACSEIQKPENIHGGTKRFYQLAGRSKEHTARETKRFTGKTAANLINEMRLAVAARLLCTTSKSILEIALECGYENLSWFHRCFRGTYKITPLTYQKRKRNNAAI